MKLSFLKAIQVKPEFNVPGVDCGMCLCAASALQTR